MAKSKSNRIISTPSQYAKEHYLYVQEVGTLQSLEPHVSRRQNLSSYLFFLVLDGNGTVFHSRRRLRMAGLHETLFPRKQRRCPLEPDVGPL